MKEIVITTHMMRRERNCYLICLLLACLTNAGAIIAYQRPWSELFTQIGYVFVISVCLYLIITVPRLLIAFVQNLRHSSHRK